MSAKVTAITTARSAVCTVERMRWSRTSAKKLNGRSSARKTFSRKRRELLIETIDGQPAASSPFARPLVAAGARIDYRGLVVRGASPAIPVAAPAPPTDEADDADEDAEAEA